MRYFLDCEFNGFKGELISLALVPSDNMNAPIFYIINNDYVGLKGEFFTKKQSVIDKWVYEHVVPILGYDDCKAYFYKDAEEASNLLHIYLTCYTKNNYYKSDEECLKIYADSYQDFKYLLELFDARTYKESYDHGSNFKLCYIDTTNNEIKSETPHNAVSDAIGLKTFVYEKERDSCL